MINNPHSPKAQLKKILQYYFEENGLVYSDFCIFVPIYGLGDKLAYLSALHHIKEKGIKICILSKSNDVMLFLYKELADFIILNDEILLNPWLHGDNYISPGNIFFMWHSLYFDGILHEVKGERKGVFDNYIGGHKLAVKFSMGLPVDATLNTLNAIKLIKKNDISEDYVFISPISNSYASSMDGDKLIKLIEWFKNRSITVILNTTNNDLVNTNFDNLQSVNFFNGSLIECLELAKGAKLSLNSRSGLSELYSMLDIPFIDINGEKMGNFWSLKDNFFRPPIYELEGIDQLSEEFLTIFSTH
ncbi:hypothetical protein [Polynucleobacter sp. AP-Kaivos-20-H2]|uniref:hypothetical protein n=1 Tax=Polynucleobacter sp. AP-Kaivos-20-H2 TaxID=2689104 RepID=UPI001C0D8067|nr:hypothetical protein [Polynucleobacter sp. AP-Kaivos-20-H2]MBU3603373.1 hypothetical protein [Polynucleobacter sp. AP-Kaivos-20-H2]